MDRSKYPPNWEAIRAAILEREGHCCKFCGVANRSVGARSGDGQWHTPREIREMGDAEFGRKFAFGKAIRMIRIVLTVAHLDHDTTNNDTANLAALCQRCHLRHDADYHKTNAAATRRRRKEEQQQALLTEAE